MANAVKAFIDCNVPVMVCNFECEYCYVAQKKLFGEQYKPFPYPVEHIARALSPSRFGGICAINLCGNGETLLHPDITSLIRRLLEQGHFVFIVTNGVITKAMEELFALARPLQERVFFKFSFHYAELKKRGLLDRFFNHVDRAKQGGASFTVELVAASSNIPYIDEIKDICMERLGALCHVTDARDESQDSIPRITQMSLQEHQALWGQFASPLFTYRQKTWDENRSGSFCYAGRWSFVLSLETGMLKQCNKGALQNIFENIEEPIHYLATGNYCPYPHCFNSHVWDCFAGVIPSIESPTYAALRDRTCANGSRWLGSRYQELYSSKVGEAYAEYDQEQKIFTNGIMALTHRDCEPDERFASVLEHYYKNSGIQTAAIYGDNRLAAWLLSHLPGAVSFENQRDADAVLVAEYKNISAVKRELANQTTLPVIDIRDLMSTRGAK